MTDGYLVGSRSGVDLNEGPHGGDPVHHCGTCGAPVLADANHCHGCGRPMRPQPLLELPSAATEKHFYVSAGGLRRVRSMGLQSSLLGE